MSEPMQARSALATFLPPKVSGDQNQKPGVIIAERQHICQLQMIAHNNDPLTLARIVTQYLGRETPLAPMAAASKNGLLICATGPLEYWIMAKKTGAVDALAAIQSKAEQSASIFDQSEGKMVLRLTGKKAADILSKGTALDWHAKALQTRGAAHTVIEHIPVLLTWQSEARHYDLSIPRSYAHSFMTWLCGAARNVGFVIQTGDSGTPTAANKND